MEIASREAGVHQHKRQGRVIAEVVFQCSVCVVVTVLVAGQLADVTIQQVHKERMLETPVQRRLNSVVGIEVFVAYSLYQFGQSGVTFVAPIIRFDEATNR